MKIVIFILLLVKISYASILFNGSKDIYITDNIKDLLKNELITINQCLFEGKELICKEVKEEKELRTNTGDQHYINLKKDLYCFNYKIKEFLLKEEEIKLTETINILEKNKEDWKNIKQNTYCFKTKEEADQYKIEEYEKIKKEVKLTLKKEDKLMAYIVLLTILLFIITFVITNLYINNKYKKISYTFLTFFIIILLMFLMFPYNTF